MKVARYLHACSSIIWGFPCSALLIIRVTFPRIKLCHAEFRKPICLRHLETLTALALKKVDYANIIQSTSNFNQTSAPVLMLF